ncbi:hypothetical protein [Streptomyces siamensis]|uniref:Uncharacterized protein n=1 Tax=Streptomyces siamensis TaxID=1274986 RepID=A0ABP9J5B5_9ACTN
MGMPRMTLQTRQVLRALLEDPAEQRSGLDLYRLTQDRAVQARDALARARGARREPGRGR